MENDNLPYIFTPNVSQYTFIEESYSILYESLLEFLNNSKEHLNNHYTDFFDALLEKISYIKINKKEDTKIFSEVVKLENDLYSLLTDKIVKDIPGDTALLDNPLINKKLIHLLYNKLYLNKRDSIKDFLINYIYSNLKSLIKKYNTISRKDISLNKLRADSDDLKNAAILFSYKEIITDILSSDNSIEIFLNSIDLDVDELDLLQQYFEYVNHIEIYHIILSNTIESDYFNDICMDVRNSLQIMFQNKEQINLNQSKSK